MPVMTEPSKIVRRILALGLDVEATSRNGVWHVAIHPEGMHYHFAGIGYQQALGILRGLELGYRLGRRYTIDEMDTLSTVIEEVQDGLTKGVPRKIMDEDPL
jgi:hypothetical protein